MKLLCLLLIPIWVFSYSVYSAPLDIAEPPVARAPGKDPPFKDSIDLIAQSPEKSEVAEVKVVHHQDLNKKILIALVVASSLLGGILLLLFCFSVYRLRILKKWNSRSDRISDTAKGISLGPILENFPSLKIGTRKGSVAEVEYQLLVGATNNFVESNVIGEGGLGRVYRAHFNDHFHAAVKKIYAGGQAAEREFENEVQCLSRIQNQNIISLLGYCTHGEERFLIYEMMENGSLESLLHGPSRRVQLTWHMRMKIALDVARGLEYLHEHCHPPLIHRDLKSSNILLDSKFNAKISDFGLAVTGGNSSKTKPKLTGTLGYVAPEYLLNGKLTDKSDVYAFGVVLLELLMGRRPVEKVAEAQLQSIVTWATPQLTDRTKLPNIIDQAIRNTMDLKHLYQVAAIAVLCVQPEPSYRPLITDVLHSFIPLVPVELGGSLRVTDPAL